MCHARSILVSMPRPPPRPTLFPYTTLFRSLWKDGNLPSPPRAAWYVESGTGMGATLQLADEKRAYRSEEHTSELQSQFHLVCRLLLEKKNSPAARTCRRARRRRPLRYRPPT